MYNMVYDSFFMGIEFECPQRDMDFFYFVIFSPYIFFFLHFYVIVMWDFHPLKKGLFGKYYRDCPMSKTGIFSSHFCVHFFHIFLENKIPNLN